MLEYVVGDGQVEKAVAVIFAVGISLGAAAVSYRLIERPAMKYGSSLYYRESESEGPALMRLPLSGATAIVKES